MSVEIWLPIKGFDKYLVSNLGNVKSKKFKEKILKKIIRGSYPSVTLYVERKPHHRYVHRLVAEAFLLRPSLDHEVNHIDGNKNNACLYNLEWVTRLQNMKHAANTGLINQKGENSSSSKLTKREVIAIRNILKTEIFSTYQIAEFFGVSQSNINSIDKNNSWSDII